MLLQVDNILICFLSRKLRKRGSIGSVSVRVEWRLVGPGEQAGLLQQDTRPQLFSRQNSARADITRNALNYSVRSKFSIKFLC